MPKRFFIINASSAQNSRLEQIRAFFKTRGETFESASTTTWDEGVQRTREALIKGYDQIVAVGGDGTINSVVNGFFAKGAPIKPDATMAIVPCGTASDYFKTISGGRDWRLLFTENHLNLVDLGRIDYSSTATPSRYFANMVSLGVSALIVRDQYRSDWMPQQLSYLIPTVKHVYETQAYTIQLDGRELKLFTLFALKGKFAGGGMRLGGGVLLNEGAFDLTVIPELKLSQRLWVLSKIYTGKLSKDRRIEKIKTPRFEVKSLQPVPLECDGELAGTTDARVEIVPRTLFVLS
jgi:diacylglycerol kinase family enzyme